jgi:hypothetical protein
MVVKTCKTCEIEKDVDEFYQLAKSGRRSKYTFSSCKPCIRKIDRSAENRAEHRVYRNHRYATNPAYRVLILSRTRLRDALKGQVKPAKTMELVGCTAKELVGYLQELIPEGEDLKKYHIDHIRPCASFDFSDPEDIAKCFHYTNLQPLTPEANMRKGAEFLLEAMGK